MPKFDFNFSGKQGNTQGYDTGNIPPNQKPGKKFAGNIKKSFKGGGIVVAVLVVIAVFSSAFYTVKDSEYAVITTFGKPNTVMSSGMHMKIPFIQQVRFVSKNIRGASIGYDEITNAPIESESLMITLDYNFINADFYIEYQVTDPVKMLYNSDRPVMILENLAQSYIRDTVGLYNVDDVLTTGKAEIQSVIKEKLINRLDSEDIGLQVINVTVQDAEPPTNDVKNAFKAVETAKQGKETAINNANKYKNEKLPEANARIDQILKSAEANKQARINEAEGQAARFNALYEEYIKYPLITKRRMFYETMEEILPEMKLIIDSGNGTQTMLPLDSFITSYEQPAENNTNTESEGN